MTHQLLLFFSYMMLISSASGQDTLISTSLEFRNIGPANQGGRIVDIEAHADDYAKVYVATGSGGVWKSNNAGTTWDPIFDDYETSSIGDIAIDPTDQRTIWVGTGEANNRNSVSWGNGIYKSTDGGTTFSHKGLSATHQIARVLVHPQEGDDVCVCAIGHLWGYSGDRGLYQSKNGGESWDKLTNGLPDDGKTGCTDLIRDDRNPDIMYAAFYHRLRQPWDFYSGGEQGGIYKTTDGGKTWFKLENGLPQETGRIGLAIHKQNPNIIMALVEAKKTDNLQEPGSGVYRSEDGGATWKYINTYNNRPFYYSQIRINPNDDQRVYLLTTRFMVSHDGGKTFKNGSSDQEVHGDFHAMWIDPDAKDRYYLGADKGLSITYDHGEAFRLIDNLPLGQFYRINYDMQKPYYVYGGLQDNGSYATASFSRDARGILSDDNWKMHWGDGQDAAINPYDPTDGYSSMENESFYKYNPVTRDIKRISPTSLNTTNYWDYFNSEEGDPNSANRFNWSAPLMMSPHNPQTIYVAGNHVYKSINKGASWEIISPDLSTNDPVKRKQGQSGGITPDNTGAETNCSVYTLAISPIDERVLWAGTDDGLVQVTTDGGVSWDNVSANIPGLKEGLWISRVEASHFEMGRAYICIDGHRSDNFETLIYKTDDYGQSWDLITNGITQGETVRVIREDHVSANLLFVGTETGVWMSMDGGVNWERMSHGLPTVPVYDIKIHPRDNDLIIGTHGRSIWIMDDISPLQTLSSDLNKINGLTAQKPATIWKNTSRGGQRGHFIWSGENPKYIENTSTVPRADFESLVPITFINSGDDVREFQLEIKSTDGMRSKSISGEARPGINRIYWNRTMSSPDLTEDEQTYIRERLEEVLKANASAYVKRRYTAFQNASDDYAMRAAIEPLTSVYRGQVLPPRLGLHRAGVGIYTLHLTLDGKRSVGTVEIVEDEL